ncbi:unnamed protein product [Darwinula stevensoni]|uniref:Intraflagellar transport protein 122 homolog n=1 Tax=Darwinula stevensoni TaxID=69355 RepID=A0A7R8X2D9_9CRUS|nr:unnamed protein product [Darwinula stevensoni]CAG0883204.1 unnamed protein product [Darwinula stevensoni]
MWSDGRTTNIASCAAVFTNSHDISSVEETYEQHRGSYEQEGHNEEGANLGGRENPGTGSSLGFGLEEIGIPGREFLREALTNCGDPLKAIEEFQMENGILLPSLRPMLPLLDLHGLRRYEFHQSVMEDLREKLLSRISEVGQQDTPEKDDKLHELLTKSFPVIKIEGLRPVVMTILKYMNQVPPQYLKVLVNDKELYNDCEIEVKRQIWQDNQSLFGDEVSPLLSQYIREKEDVLYDHENLTNLFFNASPKVRRQGKVVQKLTEMIGKNIRLYDMVLQFLRTLFLRTRNVHYCTLRAELLMALHDLEIQDITAIDPCHKFTWCLDACIREKNVDPKRSRELQSFLDGMRHGQEEVLGDIAMVLCDPYSIHFLCTSSLKIIHHCINNEQLPRDNLILILLLRILAIGLQAWDMIDSQMFREPKLDVHVVTKFLPALMSLIVDDQVRALNSRLPPDERESAITIIEHSGPAPDAYAAYIQDNGVSAELGMYYTLQVAKQKDRVGLMNTLGALSTSAAGRAYEDTFLHSLVALLIPMAEEFAAEDFCTAVFDEFFCTNLGKENVCRHLLKLVCIYDLCFKPDGTQLIVAAGNRVLVYDASDGSLLQPLKGHKDTVVCVSYAKDGKRFASGSLDKHVIIWTSKLEGILKYSHNDALQCLAYNPISHQLASCALSDFGLWSPEQKNVSKTKVNSRINACAWTNDGQFLALGHGNGVVSIRNKIGKERPIGFDPCCLSFFPHGEYILVGGSNKGCLLYTKEGIKLGAIGEQQSWVWCAKAKPDSNFVLVGYPAPQLCLLAKLSQMMKDSCMGDTQQVRKLSRCLPVVGLQCLLQGRVIKLRRTTGAWLVFQAFISFLEATVPIIGSALGHSVRAKRGIDVSDGIGCLLLDSEVIKKKQANLLLSKRERRLQCLLLSGAKEREWQLDSPIRYIKVIGGPPGKEGLLLGLKSGQVLKIFVDNQFPVPLLKAPSSVRCLDLSMSRKKLALVDDNNKCLVYNIDTKELLFQEPSANSVAWNSQCEDLLCFSGNNQLTIKACDYPGHTQKLNGFVVGFAGSRIFCLHVYNMETMEIPLSAALYQFIERKHFEKAYEVACLGITEGDWHTLAHAALEGLHIPIAKKSFTHIRDLIYLDLISSIENEYRPTSGKRGETPLKGSDTFLAQVLAYKGKFADAAKLFKKASQEQKALEMYTDLRMFDLAQEYVGSGEGIDQRQLIKKKAEWAKNINEPRAAAEMYLSAGETLKAIEIIGEHGWVDMLVEVGRKLDKADSEGMKACAGHLQRLGQLTYASDLYQRLGDTKSVVMLYVEAGDWEEAFVLAEKHPEFRQEVYMPYAKWLAESDRFVEAQQAFHKAGRPDEAFRVLEQLTHNAVNENRFCDAGYYYWVLSMQCLDLAKDDTGNQESLLQQFAEHQKKADMYYTYHVIQRYTDEPFTSFTSEQLFNIARFLVHELLHMQPKGISKFAALYALARQARTLGAFKTARYALDKLQGVLIPRSYQEAVDLASLAIRCKPYQDNEDLLPLCYRCSTTNPLINIRGNCCVNCAQPFLHSFSHFEVLPLVEFVLEDGITDEEAQRLIEAAPNSSSSRENWRESKSEGTQMLRLDEPEIEMPASEDPFTARLLAFEEGGGEYNPVVVNRATLRSMEPHDVLICCWPTPLKYHYYRNLIPDMSITKCDSCNKFYLTEDWELSVLQDGHCPFCRKAHSTGNNEQAE